MAINEYERSWEGCYGEKVGYKELDTFLEDFFRMGAIEEVESPDERFVACIWGHPGIGKTAKVKQLAARPVTWEGKKYDGYKVFDVPVAQFEEMGDLHGIPCKHMYIRKEGEESRWAPVEVMDGYLQHGWEIDHEAGIRTMYAPPEWVPTEPGPSVVLLDDFNRTSQRIVKGTMQLLQTYGMVSWKLPPGCRIVVTGNPQEQDFFVTQLDSANLTRFKHVILKEDVKEWAQWAMANELDQRAIGWALAHEEMIVGKQRTNPRTIAAFARWLRGVESLETKEEQRRFIVNAASLLDEETVTSITTYFERDVELLIDPEAILNGETWVFDRLKQLSDGIRNPDTGNTEKRIDIIAVTAERLFAYIVSPKTEQGEERVRNFQKFVTSKYLEDDVRYNICRRLNEYARHERKELVGWLLGSKELLGLIMDVA
jgi:hypothetical protein